MRGELPAWLDVPSIAEVLSALLDGMLVQAAEEGAGYRRSDHERRHPRPRRDDPRGQGGGGSGDDPGRACRPVRICSRPTRPGGVMTLRRAELR